VKVACLPQDPESPLKYSPVKHPGNPAGKHASEKHHDADETPGTCRKARQNFDGSVPEAGKKRLYRKNVARNRLFRSGICRTEKWPEDPAG